ncbi:AMP-binding protein [Mycobacterium sp. Root265]|uniref:AMP-binding protein n=1 Tax=Mycobacterium sp. Root265 TaxID=1736504 RepID=UPI00138F4307|nr:AMP-binding protein [Mycobacterium sp. Root265]
MAGLRRRPRQRITLWNNRVRRSETFATLDDAARRFAAGLIARGVRPGDPVVLWLPNGWETLVAFVGSVIAGAVVVPIASFYGRKDLVHAACTVQAITIVTCVSHRGRDYLDEVRGSLKDMPTVGSVVTCGVLRPDEVSGEKLVAFEELLAAPSAGAVRRAPDDACLMALTSGTSGVAKAVVHTHRTLGAEVRHHLTAMVPGGATPQIMASPVAHAAGMTLGLLAPIHRGEPINLIDSFDVDFLLDTAHAEGLAPGGGASVFLSALIDHPRFTDELAERMRYVILGGSVVPETLVTKAASRGLTVLRSYGLTEHPTVSASALTDEKGALARTDGRLLAGVEVEIRDRTGAVLPAGTEGMIFTRGPDRCAGYLEAESNVAFDREGWLDSGDVGVLDANGRLAVTDRRKDLIIRNGVNIAPAEVENVLLTAPSVAEVAVVGVPDDRTGERAVAFVVPAPHHHVTLATLVDHLAASGMAKPKWPEELRLTDRLPRTASGKVRKTDLRKA